MAKVMDGASSGLSGKADGRVYVQFNGGTYIRRISRRTKYSTSPGLFGEHMCVEVLGHGALKIKSMSRSCKQN